MADARIESLDRAQTEQARLRRLVESAPAAYEDRFMDLAGDATLVEAVPEAGQPQGLRAWLLESRVGFGDATTTGYGRQRAAEFGQRFEYRQETLNYGEFSLQLDGRHLSGGNYASGLGTGSLGYARDASSARFTLRNFGFPLTPRSFADTALGDVYSELTDGLARNYRLSLGSTPVRGAALRLFASGWDVRAGLGQRGNLTGGPYQGFEKSQGSLAWLGGTLRLQGPWFAALQVDQANGIPAYYFDPLTAQGAGSKNVTSWAASLGRGRELLRDGDIKLRATLLGSRATSSMPGDSGNAQGLFVEAGLRRGLYRHEFGAYAAQPRLYFGDYALATASRGAYWRVDRSASRMSWGAGLDLERTRPGGDFGLSGYERSGASANIQYLLDRRNSAGASLSVHQTRYDGTATGSDGSSTHGRSLYATAFYQTRFFDWPRSRFSVNWRRNELIVLNDSAATGQELLWEQDWIGGRYETMRPELTTTVGHAQDRSGGFSRSYPTVGLQGRYWLDGGTHLAGSLRYTSQSGGLYTSRGLSGSLSAEKALGQGWRMGFAAHFNQARASVLPTPSALPNLYRSDEKAAYVYLRWEGSAGKAFAATGLPGEGAGGGSLSGHVFYDANRDGERQAGEAGVAGVEVLLDGRYRALTDRDGRFEFPLVTTGHHRLTLTLESVPLPWGTAEDTGVAVHVPLRGQAVAAIGVIKVGE